MTSRKGDSKRVRLDTTPPHAAPAEWSEKEHIAEPAIAAAQKLLEEAGTLELAQQALATVSRRIAVNRRSK